jgi:hypothetical protein
MPLDTAKARWTVLMAASGSAGSIAVGLIFTGSRVFHFHSVTSQFVFPGIAISLLIAVVKTLDPRAYVYSSLLVLLLLPLSTGSVQKGAAVLVARDLVFGLCIAASVYAASRLIPTKPSRWRAGIEVLVWIVAVVAAYAIAGGVLCAVHRPENAAVQFGILFRLSVLIGIGVSVGSVGCASVVAGMGSATTKAPG